METDPSEMAAVHASLTVLEDLYETEIVQCTLAIASDDAEAATVAAALSARDHAVGVVTSDLLRDERPRTTEILRAFKDGDTKVLVLAYPAWAILRRDLEIYAMDHNVLWVGTVADGICEFIVAWVQDAHRRGFYPTAIANGSLEYHRVFTKTNDADISFTDVL